MIALWRYFYSRCGFGVLPGDEGFSGGRPPMHFDCSVSWPTGRFDDPRLLAPRTLRERRRNRLTNGNAENATGRSGFSPCNNYTRFGTSPGYLRFPS